MNPLIFDMCRKRNTVSPVLTLTATTTADGQVVTLQKINPQSAIVISWGDGATTSVAAGYTSAITHTYTSAGLYSVTLPRVTYTDIDIRDSKVGGTITADNPFPSVTGSVTLYNLPGLTWTVSTSNPFPAVTGTITIFILPNLTWTSGAAYKLTGCGDITYQNSLLQGAVDTVLADLWEMFPNRTKTGYTINVSTTNAAPSATGLVYASKLVNDPDNVNPTYKWAACEVTNP